MILPKGITGFRDDGNQPSSSTDLKPLLSACYEAARKLGGKVVASEGAYSRQTNNFAVVVMEFPGKSLTVALNAHYPIVGFTAPLEPSQQKIHFVDDAALRELLLAAGAFQVLAKDDLEAAVTPEAIGSLATAEAKQIRYWKPRCIGEIIFNFWD